MSRDEREARRGDIEHLATNLVGKVNECVAAIDEGKHEDVELVNSFAVPNTQASSFFYRIS